MKMLWKCLKNLTLYQENNSEILGISVCQISSFYCIIDPFNIKAICRIKKVIIIYLINILLAI